MNTNAQTSGSTQAAAGVQGASCFPTTRTHPEQTGGREAGGQGDAGQPGTAQAGPWQPSRWLHPTLRAKQAPGMLKTCAQPPSRGFN